MANWYDEPVTVKKVKQVRKVKETRPSSKNFYDVITAVKDEEIQARIDFYVSWMNENSTTLEDMRFPEKGDYDRHDVFNSLPYVLLPHEFDKHCVRMEELEEEWQEECSRECDYDDYEEKYKEAVDNNARMFKCRFKLYGTNKSQYYKEEWHWIDYDTGLVSFNRVGQKKIGFFKNQYTIRDDSGSDRYELPSLILRHRWAIHGRRFGYSERVSIFNKPTVTFNKKGEPMATAKALDVINDILNKNGATVSKTVKKKANPKADARLKNIEKLRAKWIKHIVGMKAEFDVNGKAKGISYEKNATRLDDSYFDVEFTSQRQHLGLKAGKGTFKLASRENVSTFLQDIVDAISVNAFDAQLLSHQRKVEKAKKEAKAKKENSK